MRRTHTLMLILVAVGTAVLALILPYGIRHRPELVAFGFVSFAIAFFIVWLAFAAYAIWFMLYFPRHYPDMHRKHIGLSLGVQRTAHREFLNLDDPRIARASSLLNRFGLGCFLVWLLVLALVLFWAWLT